MDDSSRLIAIAFAPLSAAMGADSPNIRPDRGVGSATDEYYLAIAVTFASLRRANTALRLQLTTTVMPPTRYRRVLDRLGVEVRIVAFAHRPVGKGVKTFVTSFYSIDALRATREYAGAVMLLDPDVICIGALCRLFDRVGAGVGAYEIDYPVDQPINGLTRREAGELQCLLDADLCGIPRHYGGEIYVSGQARRAEIIHHSEVAWGFSMQRFIGGATGFTTEEHIFSYALRRVGSVVCLRGDIERIWTARTWRRVPPNVEDLVLWHLPAEKGRGLARLGAMVVRRADVFSTLSDEEFTVLVGHAVGVPHRGLHRWSVDTLARVGKRARRILR